jgi:hypothetical protein
MKVQAKQAEQTTQNTTDEQDDETKTHTHSLLLSSLDHSGFHFNAFPFFFLLVHIVSIQISHSTNALITRKTPHTTTTRRDASTEKKKHSN